LAQDGPTNFPPLVERSINRGNAMSHEELPKISIMIPTFNQEKFISKAIESSLIQDYPNLEIIVSDDCSVDNTPATIKGYLDNKKLKYYRNDTNLGRVANYKKTLYERVTGEWALNLDGDDYLYEHDAISRMACEVSNNRDKALVAVMGSHLTLDRISGKSTKHFVPFERDTLHGIDVFLNWPDLQFGHLSTLYQVGLARKIDYYRLNTISSDWESILRLILHGEVVVIDKVIGVWNIHGENATYSKSIKQAIADYSYIEQAYRYAAAQGVDEIKLAAWFRKMVKLHTRGVWSSNISSPDKISGLVPHVLKHYPFASTEFLHTRELAENLLRIHPFLFKSIRSLYLKVKGQNPRADV
jgi:glycosyltransferase involved in cell wall biosynthesis